MKYVEIYTVVKIQTISWLNKYMYGKMKHGKVDWNKIAMSIYKIKIVLT